MGQSKNRLTAESYEKRGVSANKPDVKRAIGGIDQGLFPDAFCKAVPDFFSNSPQHCVLSHADGAGTKSVLAYMHYKIFGNANIFKGIAQDSLVMNLDDVLCVGALGPFLFSNTIGRNSKRIPGDVIRAVIHGYEEFADNLSRFDIELIGCGGETADLGDLVRTIIVDSTLTVRMLREDFIDCSLVQPGHVIIGLASDGQSIYESEENTGIGTNGFTALRHSILASDYRIEFPETFAPEIGDLAYSGSRKATERLPGTEYSLLDACLSPTRTYAPVLAAILPEFRRSISAIFHNTGGGQTKCVNFGHNVHYIKDNLFDLPPIFQFLRDEIDIPPRDLLQIFNVGHRLEIVCQETVADEIMATIQSFNIATKIVGRVEEAPGRSLSVTFDGETYQYESG